MKVLEESHSGRSAQTAHIWRLNLTPSSEWVKDRRWVMGAEAQK